MIGDVSSGIIECVCARTFNKEVYSPHRQKHIKRHRKIEERTEVWKDNRTIIHLLEVDSNSSTIQVIKTASLTELYAGPNFATSPDPETAP